MPEEKASPQDYVPFVPNSVNILTASTNSGKTTFLVDTLKHLDLYYTGQVEGVIVVLCNSCVDGEIYKFKAKVIPSGCKNIGIGLF